MEDASPKKSRNLLKRFDLKPVNKRAKKIEKATLRHAHTFVVTRLTNLRSIRRHIIGWLLLASLLIGLTSLQMTFSIASTTSSEPANGGTYAEGAVDSISTLNPLFTTTQIEHSSSRLVFSSLLKYDEQGVLQPDLAQSWEVNKETTQFSFTLRPGLTWHDGHALDADDVVATVEAIQNPRVGALAQASWSGIKVKADGERKVVFTLPGAYAPFASAATFAILPAHVLEKIAPENLRESSLSNKPVGSGPFKFVNLSSVDITGGKRALQLEAFENYWEGQPRVDRFSLYTYSQPEDLSKGLLSHEINAATNVKAAEEEKLNAQEFNEHKIALNSGVYAMFRNDSETLKEVKVRQALVRSVDIADILRRFEVKALGGPVVNGQLVQANQVKQFSFDKKAAQALFAASGWVKNTKSGYLEKNGQALELKLVTVDAGNYRKLAFALSREWAGAGVKVNVQAVDPQTVQQTVLRPRAYDILLYELELGGDADSYAYWHSSQAVGAGLNFSNYVSPISDAALTTARTRSSLQLRDAKYATFARQWANDAPALALYQPTMRYVTARNVASIPSGANLPTPSDRFYSVARWTVQTKSTSTSP